MHLGDRAYVGLSGVEGGRVNVCGLFPRRPAAPEEHAGTGFTVLLRHLRAAGLPGLARRLETADLVDGSFCAVASLSFLWGQPTPGRLCLGDSFAMTPPFTGNGMAMALQSAVIARDPLLAWQHGELDWPAAAGVANQRLRQRFRSRLTAANVLHPFLLEPRRQHWLALAGRARLLPLRPFYRLTH